MAKHLIFLGNTGSAYRLALFDNKNIVTRSIPVKDVTVLPDIPMINCTAVDGVPHPNLLGAKVLCNQGSETPADFVVERAPKEGFDYKSLWADPKVEPEYLYGMETSCGNQLKLFKPGYLLKGFDKFTVWDGTCKNSNWYILGTLAYQVSKKRFQLTGSRLCVSGIGEVALLDARDIRLIAGSGSCVIQAGAPKLQVNLGYATDTPVVTLDADEKRVVWHVMSHKKYRAIAPEEVFAVWDSKDYRNTIYDLRKFKNAKVFGITSIVDARTIIFPESTEEIWAGFIRCAPSLAHVYLPRSVDTIHEYGLPLRRIRKVTFYSDSLSVKAFSERVGAGYVVCSSAEDMLSEFYSSANGEYISVAEADDIATVADTRSKADGGDGTVVSALLLSCSVKGFAKEEIESKYPIVHIRNDTMPQEVKIKSRKADWELRTPNFYGSDYCRLLIGAFTQFYPRCEIPDSLEGFEHIEYSIGTYKVYLSFLSSVSPATKKAKETDAYVMIEYTPTSKLIHSFACKSKHIKALFHYLSLVSSYDLEPCGVLRYADKLPGIYDYWYAFEKDEFEVIKKALFTSFFPVLYHTRIAKRQILGIDLHTGCFVTAVYTLNDYPKSNFFPRQQAVQYRPWLPLVNRLSDILLRPPDWDSAVVLPRDCQFSKSKN